MNFKIINLLLALLFSFFIAEAQNQQRIVTGTITDAATGEPIPFANIILKGTTIGTITDVDGRYSITIPQGEQTLEISFIGYKSQQFKIAHSVTKVDIALEAESTALDEVVVVGYASASKKSLTGAVMTIVTNSINKKKGATWKRSGMPENSIRLEVGDRPEDFLPLQAAQMAVKVDGFRVRVLMDCFFFNDKKDRLEGTFKLRLPTNATPYYFAFGETEYVNKEQPDDDNDDIIKTPKRAKNNSNKQIPYTLYSPEDFDLSPDAIEGYDARNWENVKQARIVSKQKAANAYEQTVSARIDPALMEWAGADMFSCRVFPLMKNKLHRIVIGYDLNMTEALDFREYVLTLPSAAKEFRLDADIYASPTMMPVITPAVEAKLHNNRLYISLQNPKKKEYTIQYNAIAPVLLSGKDESFNEYFAANYRINLPEVKQEKQPGDAIFMLDVSLSSQPDKFNVWLKLMEEILKNNPSVIRRFAVVCFNIETFWWKTYYLRNNDQNVSSFLEYANTLALEGATDLGGALAEASNPSWLKNNEPKQLFLMSDADFNWGESNMHALKLLINKGDRIHTYKTGLSGTNTTVLDFLSNSTGGFSFTVTGEEEAQLTAKSFRYRPWTIEEIKVEGVEDFQISGQPSQLYNGQKLIFGGRGKPSGNIYIRVNNGKEIKELNINAEEQIESDLAKRVYGQLALNQLEGYGYKTEEATESYATYFRIPNATMSFLMLESRWDYDRFGIGEDYAALFVEINKANDVIKSLLEKGGATALGDGKTDFLTWLKRLEADEEIMFAPDSVFTSYLNSLPDNIFSIKLMPYKYKVRFAENQTDDEKNILANENLRYDEVVSLTNIRKSKYSSADALKLLSSVVERNAGDFVALRDIAIKAIEWDMGDQAYYMMRRIIANRQYEAIAYLTAAEALAKAGKTDMALIYYYICLNCDWSSDYGSFTEIAALQCLRFIDSILKDNKVEFNTQTTSFIHHFRENIEKILKAKDLLVEEADIVIIINWNTNNTDVDLHVFEPTGEECYYGNSETEIEGQLTIDVTNGYGPEMYVLRNAVNGKYRASLSYYLDDETKTSSKTKVYVDFYHNWGRPDEKHTRKTIVLETQKEKEDILQFEVKKIIQ